MADAFDLLEYEPDIQQEIKSGERVFNPKDAFDVVQPFEKEGRLKSFARSLYQIPAGMAKKFTFPLDLMQIMGVAGALDPDEIEHIRNISEREGIPFDEKKYFQAVQNAAEYFPTQENYERILEEKTGIPFTPKNEMQELLRFGGTAGSITPGSLSQKAVSSVIAPLAKKGLEEMGVPKLISEPVALGGAGFLGKKTPPISAEIKPITKPSGLPTRRYEKLKEPREVSAKKAAKIEEKVKDDFKNISDEIVKSSPLKETAEKFEINPAFKEETSQAFRELDNIFTDLPGKISGDKVKKTLAKQVSKKPVGVKLSEYEKELISETQKRINELPSRDATPKQWLEQYRKNNSEVMEYFDPQRTKAFNRAKRDAILEENRAIADIIEKNVSKEASEPFKMLNEQWSKISDLEKINGFIDQIITDKGIEFSKIEKYFDRPNLKKSFERGLGKEGSERFKQLLLDLRSTQKAAKNLKIAKDKGWQDLFEIGSSFIIHPSLGKAKLGVEAVKKGWKTLANSLLDKPQITINFKKGVDALKKGNFKEADQIFKNVEKDLKDVPKKLVDINTDK